MTASTLLAQATTSAQFDFSVYFMWFIVIFFIVFICVLVNWAVYSCPTKIVPKFLKKTILFLSFLYFFLIF